ncbi:MAG: AarF/ABC1/UbiB kinase family protein [Actinobacteria bacterium]|nr:AarF/ABC1/UbiB kinase family protein [Actinomycetota bacterium]
MRLASSVRNADRVRDITEAAVKHGFGYFLERHRLRNLLPKGWRGIPKPVGTRGGHMRRLLEELGPTFVKFGQLLSTRPDAIPEDIIDELRRLQDDVPPFPLEIVEETIESELGLTIERLFLEFDETPIAAASIGQVHRAVLPNGDRVVVKVQRPEAEAQVRADIDLLYQLAHLLRDHSPFELFFDPVGIVDQFSRGIRNELDYHVEARNAERFQENFYGDETVRVPKVYWQYSTSRVLTLEYLDGIQLVDVDRAVMDLGERRALATTIAQCWLKQVYIDGFFHGDPHPANIMVFDDGTIGLVDFGIAGRLSGEDRQNIISLFLDIMNERIESIPKRLSSLGVDFPRSKEADFVTETRDMFTKYYGASLDEVDPVMVMRDVFGAIYRLQLKLPSQYLLLERVAATLEGIGKELYPGFNVFEFARPYTREFLKRRNSPENLLARGSREVQGYVSLLRDYPQQIHDALGQITGGELRVNFVHRNLEDPIRRFTAVANRLTIAIMLASIILGSSVIGLFAQGGPTLMGVSVFALFGFLTAGFFGVWLIVGILRSGRL